jgi:hypothetical protein
MTPVLDHPWVLEVLRSGAVARALLRAAAALAAAAQTSAAGALVARGAAAWRSAHWAARRRAGGLLLLVAAAVHVLLTAWQGWPNGWVWLIVPGTTAVTALLVLAAAMTPQPR